MGENKPCLRDFPPKLRKLALNIAKSDTKKSIKEHCEELNLKYDSILSMIYQEKQKGKDFHDLIDETSFNYLRGRLHEADRNLADKAISPSETNPKFLELYYKRVGKLKDSPLVQIDNRSLTVVVSPNSISSSIPENIRDSLPEEDISELEIEGPKHK